MNECSVYLGGIIGFHDVHRVASCRIVSLRFWVLPRCMHSMTCIVSLCFRVLPRCMHMRIQTIIWVAHPGQLRQIGPKWSWWAWVDYTFFDIWAWSGGPKWAYLPGWVQGPRRSIFVPTNRMPFHPLLGSSSLSWNYILQPTNGWLWLLTNGNKSRYQKVNCYTMTSDIYAYITVAVGGIWVLEWEVAWEAWAYLPLQPTTFTSHYIYMGKMDLIM
jgi:hypothetical protein